MICGYRRLMLTSMIRLLVANEPRAYQEAMTVAIEGMRPHIEVTPADPSTLDSDIARVSPHMVLCSRLTPALEGSALAWVLLYPEGESRAVVCIADERTDVERDLDLSELLSIIDRVEVT